jgi:membrane-bound serine protease (ClpP class)
LLLVDGPIPELRVKFLTAIAVAIPFGVITVFLMTIALRARRNKVTTGVQGMIGQLGLTRSALSPSGQVVVQGEIWTAQSSTPIPAGEPVTVRAVDGLTLLVEPVHQPALK